MKFVYIKIPITVEEPGGLVATSTQTLDVRMFVEDTCSHEEAARRLSERMTGRLDLIDLGDET